MVFRGRPSTGCGKCRRKKIRCDQVRPACSQCLKSKDGAPCPGYRDQQALKFLDESSQVALKVQRKQLSKPGRQEYGSETSNSSSDSASSSPPGSDESPLSSALAPSLENQGIRYFIANYVMPDSDLCSGHLQNLLSFKTTQSKTIQVAMEAAGLAGLSNSTNNPSLMAKARQQYAMALRMTKAHLADPSRCKQDRTFTAVALLGLFEVMTCSSPASLKSWASHIEGSIALLNIRGADLLNSEFGWAIFAQARTQILMSCFQTESHVPPVVLTLGHQLSQCSDLACRVANELLDLGSQLCEIRASIKDGSFTNPSSIISSLLALDTCVISWGTVRSSRWNYTTVFVDHQDPETVYDESYCVYKASWFAGAWNIQRATRIFLHEAILAQIDALTSSSSPSSLHPSDQDLDLLSQRFASLSTISSLASDICASVPYLLGHDRPLAEQISDPVPAACGYFLVMPLYLAGSTVGVPRQLRTYVLGRLRYIGWRLGVRQALLLAGILKTRIIETVGGRDPDDERKRLLRRRERCVGLYHEGEQELEDLLF